MDAGAGDADVEQPALLLHLRRRVGVGDRHGALVDAGEEHGVPLEAFRGVEGGQRHPVGRGGVLGRDPLVEYAEERGQVGAWLLAGQVAGEGRQCRQRLPAFANSAGTGRRFGCPTGAPRTACTSASSAGAASAAPSSVSVASGASGSGVAPTPESEDAGGGGVGGPGRAAEQHQGLANLRSVEEPLGATEE